ncbi:MAG: MltA domain-containing protein [Sulfuricella sp.]|nr:MltA domain-containing protein [Sulfuricella sp.]
MKSLLTLLLTLTISACATLEKPPTAPVPAPTAPVPAPTAPAPAVPPLQPVGWEAVSGWTDEEPAAAWEAFVRSCSALRGQPAWQPACAASAAVPASDGAAQRKFFEQYFTPYQAANPDGATDGLITGYYEPLLHGSRTPSKRFRYPLYGVPDDLLIVDLSSVYPELKSLRLRGRLEGRRVVPYYSRADIDNGAAPLKGKELYWVDDAVELFFLQIQGSGKIALPGGETVHVGYADQNGLPYRSIGKVLVDRGDLPLEKASMQGIKDWGKRNQAKLPELLGVNASYVFFRDLPNDLAGPLGALGVPLTAERSIAVDARYIPLGAPVFLATTWPNSAKPLNRLMLAQDTGGAIRGPVRADFYWGFGQEAGKQAGSMKQSGKMWVLLPKGYVYTPPQIAAPRANQGAGCSCSGG